MSVSRHTTCRPFRRPRSTICSARIAGVFERLHERAVADLHVQDDRVGARRELLRHDRRGDQRDDVHSRGHVSERVELLVGRHEIAGLADDREPDLAHLLHELVDRQLDPEARDRLELVERAARVSEPAAAHLPERAHRRRPRSARPRATSCRPRLRSSACRPRGARAPSRDRASRPTGSSRPSANGSRGPRAP